MVGSRNGGHQSLTSLRNHQAELQTNKGGAPVCEAIVQHTVPPLPFGLKEKAVKETAEKTFGGKIEQNIRSSLGRGPGGM